MDVTRIVRRPVAVNVSEQATRIIRKPVPTEAGTPAPGRQAPAVKAAAMKAAAVKSRPALLPLARFALVALVFGKDRAAELLEGLGAREAERAKEHLAHFAALSSAERQGRVALEFGVRSDPSEQLRDLMAEAPEPLRREIFRRLPPYQRSFFPERRLEPADGSVTPAMQALADRLIREAVR